MAAVQRVLVTLSVLVLLAAVAAVVLDLATADVESGHCRGSTYIGPAIDGFPALGTALDTSRLAATVDPDRVTDVFVGQSVTAPDAEPQPSRDGRVIAVNGQRVTVSYTAPFYATEPPTLLVPGSRGRVTILTSYYSKTSLVPTAALRRVPGSPNLAIVRSTTGLAPVEPRAIRVHVVGRGATWEAVDPDTARRVGAVGSPFEHGSVVIAPDRACRAGGSWPRPLTQDQQLP